MMNRAIPLPRPHAAPGLRAENVCSILLASAALALIGCLGSSSVTNEQPRAAAGTVPIEELPVVAWFDAYDAVLSGSFVRSHPFFPRALELDGRSHSMRCLGEAPLTELPTRASPPEICDGMSGVALLRCSDDREIRIGWITDPDCASGYGQGVDQDGNRIILTFGGTQEVVEKTLEEATLSQIRKPTLPPVGASAEAGVGTGTAFFVSWTGHLITNHHVVDGASRVLVSLDGEDLVEAEVLRTDEENDLALLHIDAIRAPLFVRREHAVERGSEIVALGYPLLNLQGREQKATFGHINALSGLQGDERFTQMDAPIQPGNSGGPVLTRSGEVVGVVTQMLSPTATLAVTGTIPQNVNYAIKSDLVHRMLRRTLGDEWKAQSERVDAAEWPSLIRRVEYSVVLVLAEP